jgi:hypothetical protein
MAIPVINTTQSILSYRQWQANAFQASATNSPTRWRIFPAAPIGMAFDETTGRVYGKPSLMGIYNFTLEANNADGWSAPASFTIGVYYAEGDFDSIVRTAIIDVETRRIAITPVVTPVPGQTTPSIFLKSGDDLILKVLFFKGDTQLDLDLFSLYVGVKSLDTESLTIKSLPNDWEKVVAQNGASTLSHYLLYLKVSSAALTSDLSDVETDAGTFLDGLGEIEWVMESMNDVGPNQLRGSTETFPVRITRDLIA